MVENPDYGILIVGYSLGGGVASLITEELLYRQRQNEDVPNETMIRCITYGAPPTYSCPENYKNPNIFSMKNYNDCVRKTSRYDVFVVFLLIRAYRFGPIKFLLPHHFYLLASAHLNAVSRLFEKMSLIRRLQLDPVVMADMFRKRGFLEHEDEDDRVKEYTGKMSKNWQKVNGLIYY